MTTFMNESKVTERTFDWLRIQLEPMRELFSALLGSLTAYVRLMLSSKELSWVTEMNSNSSSFFILT